MIEFKYKITEQMLKNLASYVYDEIVYPLNEKDIAQYTKQSYLLSKKEFTEKLLSDKLLEQAICQKLHMHVTFLMKEHYDISGVILNTTLFKCAETLDKQAQHVASLIKERDYEKTMAAQEDNMVKTLESRGYTVIKKD